MNGKFSLDLRNSRDIFETLKQQRLRLHRTTCPLRDLVQSLPVPASILISISKVAYLPWANLRYAVKKEGTLIKILLFLKLINFYLQIFYCMASNLKKRKNNLCGSRLFTPGHARLFIYGLKPTVKPLTIIEIYQCIMYTIKNKVFFFSGKWSHS